MVTGGQVASSNMFDGNHPVSQDHGDYTDLMEHLYLAHFLSCSGRQSLQMVQIHSTLVCKFIL